MTGLWVPPKVAREQYEQTAEFKAEIVQMVSRFEGQMRYWTERYQRELDDDRLEIIFAPPTANPELLSPGRYHVLRHNEPPAPPTIEPIEDPETGGFVEPGPWHIEKMRHSDLQNHQLIRQQEINREKERQAKERQKEREQEEWHEELRERYKAATQTSISMNRDMPWSQNVAGQKRRGKKA